MSLYSKLFYFTTNKVDTAVFKPRTTGIMKCFVVSFMDVYYFFFRFTIFLQKW